MLSLLEADNDRTVDVRVGDVIRITLPENATTGYRWTIDRHDEDIIEALGSEPRYPDNAVGAGGEIAFNFKARKAGTGEIALRHWRHWEGDRSVIGRFRVRLNVQS
jgi:inhibitor of cysteine peptidase